MKILVIGGSFGGLTAAFELKRHLGKKHEITLICDQDTFVFIPSLPWLCMGWVKEKDITLDLKKILGSKGIRFINSDAKKIDPEKKTVTTSKEELSYDYLVIATGAYLNFDAIPGLNPKDGFTYSIFMLEYAVKANKAWNRFLNDPGPVVIGAPQGASCFGPAYELAYMIDTELRKRKIRHKVPMTFVTSEPYLGHMGIGGVGKSRRAIEDSFQERDIKSITNTEIEEITKEEIKLKDGTILKHSFSMIVPPFRGVDAIINSKGLGNPKGFVPADEYYRHPSYPNIYTVGVAMALAPPEPTPVPTGVPKTGFMTEHMAKIAAKNIAASIKGGELVTHSLDVFCILDAGDKATFMYASPTLPPRNKVFLKETRLAHHFKKLFERYFLWKMRYGLTRLP
ncbi:MAG: FAD/NAD(P)-binding oxidoreductase [Candidatus Hydrothermarchaeales archaeon]